MTIDFMNRIHLSDASLQYAIAICQEKERYKVGIASVDNEEVKEKLLELIKNCDYVKRVTDNKGGLGICFKNDSFIKFINTSCNACGQRYNLLIIDKNIPENIAHIISRCYMPYYKDYEDYIKSRGDKLW